MKSDFDSRAQSITAPSGQLEAVTPSDTDDLAAGPTRALYVGGAGSVAVMDRTGAVVAIESAACQYHPIRVARVLSSGTTATGIVALY